MTASFKELKVWQQAHEFVLKVYKTTKIFPEWERYALTSQFLRAAVSIPANIAEGYRKMGKSDKLKFMNIAQGSLEECRYYIILAKDLGYINIHTHDVLEENAEIISKLLTAYCKPIIAEKYKNDVK
jgi:four helix bundle protein